MKYSKLKRALLVAGFLHVRHSPDVLHAAEQQNQ